MGLRKVEVSRMIEAVKHVDAEDPDRRAKDRLTRALRLSVAQNSPRAIVNVDDQLADFVEAKIAEASSEKRVADESDEMRAASDEETPEAEELAGPEEDPGALEFDQ